MQVIGTYSALLVPREKPRMPTATPRMIAIQPAGETVDTRTPPPTTRTPASSHQPSRMYLRRYSRGRRERVAWHHSMMPWIGTY